MIAPVAPTGWPSEMPEPFGLTLAGSSSRARGHGAGLRGKGFVGLDHVEVVDAEAGAFEGQARGRYRAQAHQLGVHAGVGVGHQPSQRLEPARLDGGAGGQNHGRCGVVQTRGVAGRHRTVLLESRLHGRQLLQGHIAAHMLVSVEDHSALARGHGDGDDLALEPAFGDGAGRALLTGHRQRVLHVARDAGTRRNVLGRDAHVDGMERVVQHAEHVVGHGRIAHACPPSARQAAGRARGSSTRRHLRWRSRRRQAAAFAPPK